MSGTIGFGQSARISSGQVDSGTTVTSGGVEFVLAGGQANGTVLDNGGTLVVSAGGGASGTVLYSGSDEYVSSGGVVTGAVLSGGYLYVSSGATLSALVVSSGHQANIGAGVTAIGTVVSSGGTVTDNSGGLDLDTVLSSGGILYVSSGATAVGTVLAGGTLYVFSGATISALTINSGHYGNINNGVVADATVVNSGGSFAVWSGAVDSGATLNSGGVLYVSSGGLEIGTQLDGGTLTAYAGATISGLAIGAGHYGNVGSGVRFEGAAVRAGGSESVLAGGIDSGAVVSSGGLLTISSGALDIGATILSGGMIDILPGGVVSGLVVSNGGIVEGPTIAIGSSVSATFTAAGSAVRLDSGLGLADPDSTTLAGATVSVASGFQSGDVLAATTTGTAIAASYNSATGLLTLSGTDTLADYQAVLDGVTFSAGTASVGSTRTIAWTATDGSAASPAATSYVVVSAGSGQPVITVQNETVYTYGTLAASALIASVTPASGITYYDFRDDGGGGGYFTSNGVVEPTGSWITVSAGNLSQLVYNGDAFSGTETVDVAAWNGVWSYYKTATITTQVPPMPVVTVQNQTVAASGTLQASALIVSDSDPSGLAITRYDFRDDGGGAGQFSLNGTVEPVGTWITVTPSTLSELVFDAGASAASETVDIAVGDANSWSYYQTATITTQVQAPSLAVQNQTVAANASIQASSFIGSISDPNNKAILDYDFLDEGGNGGYLVLNGVPQTAGNWISVATANLAQMTYHGGGTAGTETVEVAVWDGVAWSTPEALTVTTTAPAQIPVLTVESQSVTAGAAIQASSLIASVTDPANRAITEYQFRDDGGGAGYFLSAGTAESGGSWIQVSVANLAQLVYQGGSSAGTETVDVEAYDGANWSQPETTTITTLAILPPVVTVHNLTMGANATVAASALIATVVDPNNDAITEYQFRDDGGGAGYFLLNGAKQATQTWITVSAANLAQLVYQAGTATGTETVEVEAYNGHVWSTSVTATINTQAVQTSQPPVLTLQNQTLDINNSIQASALIASIADPNNYAITSYEFRDDGSNGYFMLDGVRQPGGAWITISASQLADLLYVGGATPGSETVNVAVYDGHSWSATGAATITTAVPQNAVPVITAQAQTVAENGTIQASSLIASVTDPNNLAITTYGFRDDGGGGGYFSLAGTSEAVGNWFQVTAAQLGQLVYVGGASAATETVDVAAYDGFNWSTPATTTIATQAASLPVVAAQNQTVNAGQSIQASSLIASVSDPNNLAITSYRFRDDGGGGGNFTLNGVAQGTGSWITVSAANLSQLLYVGGSSAGTETADIEVSDGSNGGAWSNYATASITTYGPASVAQVVASLTNAGIKTDVANLLVNGSLSYSAMLTILQDVASSDASSGLTASQLADLKTLVANFNTTNGIQVSQYVYYISEALILGNPANKDWTGGGLSTSTLLPTGVIGVGTTQTQLDELIGKWFLGTDLPDAAVPSGSEAYGQPVQYVADTNPLFDSNGEPSVSDVNQGQLGDCYLLASLAEIAQMQPSAITSMFVSDGNGVYGVRFYVDGAPVYVTVNDMLPMYANYPGDYVYNTATASWASLIEKAYVELNQEPGVLGGGVGYGAGNAYALIAGGNADPITTITGRETTEYDSTAMTATQWSALKQTIVTAIQNNFEVDFGTDDFDSDYTYATNGQEQFVGGHMYSTLQYDSVTGDFIVRNPWGGQASSTATYQVEFEASMAQLYSATGSLYVANSQSVAGPALTLVTPPVVMLTGAVETFLGAANPVPVVLDPGVSLQDASSSTLVGATIAILAGWTAADTLAATITGNITQSFNSTTGVLTLTGSDSLGDYQTVLRSITFTTTGATTGSRTISWEVSDGTNESAPTTSFLGVVAAGPVVSGGGTQVVSSGTLVAGTSVSSGGVQDIGSGGVASGTMISSGGSAFVLSGGAASGAVIAGGGQQQVWSGGTASGTVVEAGGAEYVYGTDSTPMIAAGGAEYVGGGQVSGASVYGAQFVFGSGGVAAAGTVSSGGFVDAYSGGAASGATVAAGGWEIVWGGGTASGAVVSSAGYDDVYSGGVAAAATISAGGWQFDWGNGSAVSAVVAAGGGIQDVYLGGVANGTQVGSGSWQFALSGGQVSGTVVSAGAWQLVWSGGGATGGSILSGGAGDVFAAGTISGGAILGGWLFVSGGGSAGGEVASSGGYEFLYSGGSAGGTVVQSGGWQEVWTGGVASGATVLSGGVDFVYSGGVDSAALLSSGAVQDVYGSAAGTVVQGGYAAVLSGGVVSGASITSGGTLYVASGGAASGTVTFTGAGSLQLAQSDLFSATIAGLTPSDLIDLSNIAYGAATTVGYAGTASSGTLTVSDGTHTAHLALLGQYVAGNFSLLSDGFGGTLVVDPPVIAGTVAGLVNPGTG